MTAREGAAYLGVSRQTFDKYVAQQGLPVHRLGTGPKAQRRVYASEIDAWLRNRWSDEQARQPARGGAGSSPREGLIG
jgi:excisionase family DNA binding protein